jgi:hypothetical protein
VGVKDQDERHAEHRQVAALAVEDAVHVRPRGDEGERGDHRVHPRLLRVVGEVRVDRGEPGADPAGERPEDRPPDPVGERDAGEGEDQRERVRRVLAVPEPADPDVEKHVVERRRAVLAQEVGDRAERMVGDPDREPLVDPEARAEDACADVERDAGDRRQA